jgi:aminopeptidase YwaD
MQSAAEIIGRVGADKALPAEFEAICNTGGRLAGTESERRAIDLVKQLGAAATSVPVRSVPVRYGGWTARQAELKVDGIGATPCHPLVRSIATGPQGVTAEVIDLGRGTPEEFAAHRDEIAGRIALVRHELMFAAGTIHRRRKYEMARQAGAAGFLIAGPLSGSTVAGSSGRDGSIGIPAAGISPETAARFARRASGRLKATLIIETDERDAETETLLFDMPGQTGEWIVLSAHIDGHDLAESAMDNATGVAAALAVARALAPDIRQWRRGLRLAFFSVEEWALTGSAQYVAGLSEAEKSAIALNINLDTIAGSPRLAALTSGFPHLEPFLLEIAEANAREIRCVRPLMANSDHANFALAGIPAFRLVAGFDDPQAYLRLVLTAADTRDKVNAVELASAAQFAACVTAAAACAEQQIVEGWREERVR